MDMKMITVRFSREKLGGLMIAGVVGLVLNQPALAQQFSNGPSGSVSFGANGPQAVLNMPTAVPMSNVDAAASQAIFDASQAGNSNGDTGEYGRTSYKTGEAPNSAGLSGNGTAPVGAQRPNEGQGSNYGLSQMTNGLMAPNSVNNAGIPLWNGMSYGFNTNPQRQTYDMSTGTNKLINQVINRFGGGFFTAGGPALPATSTGSVNIDIAPNAGH